jgi:hypothetical protein
MGDSRTGWDGLRQHLPLGIVLILATAIRCVNLTSPRFEDLHSFRQAETASFAHGYLVESFLPWLHSASRYPCAYAGARFGFVESELPLPSWLAAVPLKAIGLGFPPAPYLRIVWIGYFLIGCLYLYALLGRLGATRRVATLAVVLFAAFPLSVFFTRAVMPDGPSLTLGFALLFHLQRWLDTRRRADELLVLTFAAVALLSKISNAYLGFPAMYLLWSRVGVRQLVMTPRTWVWLIVIVLPVAAWYGHVHTAPWSFGLWAPPQANAGKYATLATLTDGRLWLRFGHRLVRSIVTWGAIPLIVVGAVTGRHAGAVKVAAAWFAGFFVFFLIAFRGNAVHNYYQLPLVVPAAIVGAYGVDWLWDRALVGRGVVIASAVTWIVIGVGVLSPATRGREPGFFRNRPFARGAVALLEKHVPENERIISELSRPEVFYNSGRRGYFTGKRGLRKCLETADARYALISSSVSKNSRVRRILTAAGRWEQLAKRGGYSLWKRVGSSS